MFILGIHDMAPGYLSCRKLIETLRGRFGDKILLDELSEDCDAFGWYLPSRPNLVFSLSTSGGELPEGLYDLRVSIIDDTLRNGDILFGLDSPDLNALEVCDVVEKFMIDNEYMGEHI